MILSPKEKKTVKICEKHITEMSYINISSQLGRLVQDWCTKNKAD